MSHSFYGKLPVNHGGFSLPTKYIVRLSDEERETCSHRNTRESVWPATRKSYEVALKHDLQVIDEDFEAAA